MYKMTSKSADIWNVDIDMRYEADGLTEEFGIDILYVRNNKYVRCRCFDDLNKTGDPKCKLCMGSGHFSSLEKIKVIESQTTAAYTSNNNITQTPIGVTEQKDEVYYIKYPFVPKERDVILKVTWDKHGYPIDIVKVLEIKGVYEMRGDHGRVELNGCIVNDRTDLMPIYNKVLKSLPRKVAAPLLKGGKSIWPSEMLSR